MARPAGLEPATTGLEGRCSIQLSYGRAREASISVTSLSTALSVPRGQKAGAPSIRRTRQRCAGTRACYISDSPVGLQNLLEQTTPARQSRIPRSPTMPRSARTLLSSSVRPRHAPTRCLENDAAARPIPERIRRAHPALSGGLLSAGVIVDPHGLFGTGRYPVLVATSRSEKVASLATASPPQALIFGSSIMMRVDPAVVERLTTLTTFNLSVDSGKSEDFVALLEYGVRNLRLRPRLAIVGLSPRTFTGTGERRIRRQAPGQRPAAPLRPDESGGQGLAPSGRLPRHAGLDVHERRHQEPPGVSGQGSAQRARSRSSSATGSSEPRSPSTRADGTSDGPAGSRTLVFLACQRSGHATSRSFAHSVASLESSSSVIVTPDDPEVIAYANSRLNGLSESPEPAAARLPPRSLDVGSLRSPRLLAHRTLRRRQRVHGQSPQHPERHPHARAHVRGSSMSPSAASCCRSASCRPRAFQ